MPSINPTLARLGFQASDRVALIHADDIGMCQATLPAIAELLEGELVRSGGVMVPCPWFREAARLCCEREFDVGVHLTLTSEWDGYRWRPLSTCDAASGLIDAEGFFPRRTADLAGANPGAARTEMRAQIARAREAGLALTHVDTHMHAAVLPEFLPAYLKLSAEFGLPAFLRPDRDFSASGSAADAMIRRERGRGLPVFDALVQMPLWGPVEGATDRAKAMLDALAPGLTCVLIHPADDTPELRSVTPDWPYRVQDYKVFRSQQLLRYGRKQGIHFIGYRPLLEVMRAGDAR